jgi:hypothetical protein
MQIQKSLKYFKKKGVIKKVLILLKKEMKKAINSNVRSKAKVKDQYETPNKLKKDLFNSLEMVEEEDFDFCIYRED